MLPRKSAVGKQFKQDAKLVTEALAALSAAEVGVLEDALQDSG